MLKQLGHWFTGSSRCGREHTDIMGAVRQVDTRGESTMWYGMEQLEPRLLLSATFITGDYIDLTVGNWWHMSGTVNGDAQSMAIEMAARAFLIRL